MTIGLIGRKRGMTRVFTEQGDIGSVHDAYVDGILAYYSKIKAYSFSGPTKGCESELILREKKGGNNVMEGVRRFRR